MSAVILPGVCGVWGPCCPPGPPAEVGPPPDGVGGPAPIGPGGWGGGPPPTDDGSIGVPVTGGDRRSDSLRLVFGCFWMVSSCPSRGFKYCICCGEGTGIRLTSLLDDELPLNWGCIPLPKSGPPWFPGEFLGPGTTPGDDIGPATLTGVPGLLIGPGCLGEFIIPPGGPAGDDIGSEVAGEPGPPGPIGLAPGGMAPRGPL